MSGTLIQQLAAVNGIRDIDLQLAEQLQRYEQAAGNHTGQSLDTLALAGVMVSVALGKGQVCLPLSLCLVAELKAQWQQAGAQQLAQTLATCHTVWPVQAGNDYQNQPLVLDQQRLYLARYYFYEQGVLQQIRQRLASAYDDQDDALTAALQQLFGSAAATPPDWQKIAAASACVQNFAVITGGPGTGKTTTVTRLLSALLSLNPQMSIALAAPTGKAAARMTESIRQAKQRGGHDALMHAAQIPDDSYTLHRLLGWTPRGFRYHAWRTLPFDCVVVDEASMVDLPMMHHLFSALSAGTRLILLGDRDQLASVEAGSVLADLCDAGVSHGPSADFAARLQRLTGCDLSAFSEAEISPMQNAVSSLRVSHRFAADSGIGHLAAAVNRSDSRAAQQAFAQFDDIDMDRLAADHRQPYWLQARWQTAIRDGYRAFCTAVAEQQPATAVFSAFAQFQVLVALRQGIYGVEQVNSRIEQLLTASALLPARPASGQWYAGRPVMISRNDYDLGLFNGDIGIALPWTDEPGRNGLRVAFPDADGSIRWILPSRLPAHETAWAMTVHKSQGSEFTHLCLLLPDQWQTVITRELIYTAITRAKQTFHLFSSESCWEQGVSSRVQRASGLRDALWGPAAMNYFEVKNDG